MKTKQIITVCLLAAFLAGFGLWSVLRTPDAVSQAERRPLAQRPAFTAAGFLSGKFSDALDDFAADQFPLREQLRTLRSLVSYDLLGQRDVDGVYLSGGYAAKLDFPLNTGSVDRAAQRFRYVYDTYLAGTEANVYLSVIPDKGYFLAPASGRPAMDYDALVSRLREGTPEMTYIDLFDRLTFLRNLQKRKEEVSALIAGQEKMTPEIQAAIDAAKTITEVEDIYRPIRPHRKPRASDARERG